MCANGCHRSLTVAALWAASYSQAGPATQGWLVPGGLRPPGWLLLLGQRHLTKTDMVTLTVWPPFPYAVKVYVELVIG